MVARLLAAPRLLRVNSRDLERHPGLFCFLKKTKEVGREPLSFFYREEKSDKRRSGGVLSGDSWEDERVVEVSQKISISKIHIENKNQACYSTNTQMQSNI